LEYIDEVMRELAGKPPLNRSPKKVEKLTGITLTLRQHYHKKRKHYAFQGPPDYDRDLLRIFSLEPRHKTSPSALSVLRRFRRELCHEVSEGTGVHTYAIDQMLIYMMNRCRELKLRVALTEEHARQKLLVLLTIQTMNGIHSGYHRIAL
jgi:hypothetical protein